MAVDQVDVLIIGAGLSGVGAACHLRRKCPEKTFAILESRGAIGGTWDLFRYPGIRSDSDMFTLGFPFRPWPEEKSMAGGAAIRSYICDTAREYGVADKIRFHHRVTEASWSSADARWTVTAHRADTAETVQLRCRFLFMCTGYYRYDEGYTPQFTGLDRFAGQVVHPQHWPEELDYTGKRVVVIGSGATAVTVVPAMAERAAHVTMLQRSPSYVLSLPEVDVVANALRRTLPRKLALSLVRWKNVLLTMAIFQLSRRAPGVMRSLHRRAAQSRLPQGYDVQTHFNPGYDPWDQRMCFVPDGDLFNAISSGKASVVTGHIDTFTKHGIRLASGAQLDADIVVTATGLNLQPLGGMRLVVDGAAVELAKTVAYKGMMLSGVPNLMLALGYTNAAWTLKCDLTSEYACRLLQHMDRRGYQVCTPVAPDSSQLDPLIDLQSGYVLRSLDKLPRQGPRAPWRLYQNYPRDVWLLRHGAVEDEGVRFSRAPAPQPAAPSPHA